MTKKSPAMDRAVRIELLRARAAIERESLVQGIAAASRTLEPAALFRHFLPGIASSGLSRWAMRAIGLARRYPFISSSLSAMVMRSGGKSKLFKFAGGVLVGWQLLRIWRDTRQDRGNTR